MPVVRGTMAEALAPGLNMRTFDTYRQVPEIYRNIVSVRQSARAYEEDFLYAGFGPLAPKSELGQTIMDEPVKIGGVRFIHKSFALGFEISEEMRDDAQIPLAMDLAAGLGRSSRYTAELYGHDVYNNGFAATKYVGRDGLELFSTAHPVKRTGGTLANRPAVDTDLTQEALEAAYGNFAMQLNEEGMPILMMPTILLVHPSQLLNARRLLETAQDPGTNNNDINPLQGWVRPVPSPFIVDQDAWFLLGPPNEIDVRFYWRKLPDTRTWDDDDAEATIHKISQRHSTGFGDWRGTYGSPGA